MSVRRLLLLDSVILACFAVLVAVATLFSDAILQVAGTALGRDIALAGGGKAFVSLLVLSIAFAIFSYRRWRDYRVELAEHASSRERLQRTASELRTIINAFPDLYFWIDGDGSILQYYAVEPADLYVRPEEFLGKRMADVLPPDVGATIQEALARVGATGSAAVVRYSLNLGSEVKEFEAAIAPLEGDRYLFIARDVTESIQATRALSQNEQRLQAIINSEPECIKIVGLDERLIEMNPAGLRMMAAESLAEVRGNAIANLVFQEDREAYRQFFRSVAAGTAGQMRFRMADLKGGLHWMESNSVPLRDPDGRITSVLSVTRDITDRVEAENALRKSEERYRSLIFQSSEGIFVVEPQSRRIQEGNPAFLSMLGLDEVDLEGMTLEDVVAASQESIDRNVEAALSHGYISIATRQYRHKSGTLIDVEVHGSLVSYGNSQVVLVSVRDISERKKAEALQSALYRIAEKTAMAPDLDEFFRSIHDILGELMYARNFYIAVYDESSELLSFPYFVDELDAAPPKQHPGRTLTGYVLRTKTPILVTAEVFDDLVRRGEVEERGSPSVDWLGVPLTTGDKLLGVLVVQSYNEGARLEQRDKEVLTFVSQHIASALERKRAEDTIRHQAYHDVLTRLPNRLLFGDRFLQALAHAQRNKQMLAMLFLDLDRFKTINDTLGHAVGDRLLQAVAERLSKSLRDADTIARLGGDEFMLLVSGVDQPEDAAKVAEKIHQSLRPSFQLDHHELHVTTSIGISLYPHDGEDVETLFKNADVALYRAKDLGRDTYQLYAPAMNARAFEQLALENRLRVGLERRQFLLHYQPLVSIRTGEIVGVEALVRWRPMDGEIVMPSEFIGLTEDTGLIVPLGEWVLRTACEQVAKWNADGLPSLSVSVNISARQFQQNDLVEMVARVLDETQFDAKNLELELTESAVMQNPEGAVEILRDLGAMGIRISIDDFGMGYSSLSYLRRFPIHTLKIDQSFVRDCLVDSDDAAIVGAIMSMGRSLKLQVVAEGVETSGQLEFLRGEQCDIAQGYFFSPPRSAEDLATLLARGRCGTD